jgi:hypothetical protein
VLQVCAKSHFTGGWASPNAGTFRLYGLGQSWNETSSARDANVWEENRVMVPDDPVNPMGQGRVTHADFRPDGSGSLAIDMNDVYGGAEGRLYTMYGNFRNPSGFKDLGIRAKRAMAVDYSGTCGAPCLLVLVDRVRGGKSKVWTWNLGDLAGPKGNKAAVATKVSISGNAFTIAKGSGTLRGTFVAPATARITQETKEVVMEKAAAPRRIPSIFAQGGDDFFLVATVQDVSSPPPQVKVEGTGLDAKVTVGGQTIRFDGQKIVLAARGKVE